MKKPLKLMIDIGIVAVVSLLALGLEDQAIARGWIPFGEVVRGASAVVAGALAAVGVVRARGGTLADLGFERPERWARVPFQVVAILVAFIVMQLLTLLLVSSVISMPEPDLSRYDSLAGIPWAPVALALVLPLTASIPEEVIYRGFLIGRFSELLGENAAGAATSVLLQAILFGSVHFMWGFGGMLVTFVMGLVWGAAYLWCGRNLWIVILAHSVGHILGVVQLYLQASIII